MVRRSILSYSVFSHSIAMTLLTAVMAMGSPAMATDAEGEIVKVAPVAPKLRAIAKKHSVRALRVGHRHPVQTSCCDAWYGRQFVLILGIGY